MTGWNERRLRRAEQRQQQEAVSEVRRVLARLTDRQLAELIFECDDAAAMRRLEALGVDNALLTLALGAESGMDPNELQARMNELMKPVTDGRRAAVLEHVDDDQLRRAREKYDE